MNRKLFRGATLIFVAVAACLFMARAAVKGAATQPSATTLRASAEPQSSHAVVVPEPHEVGGEPQSVVRVANLIYAGTQTSKCFADHFLLQAEQDSTISTSRRLHSVKLADNEVFEFPLVIMTGEGSFELLDSERANLRKYVEGGGFLLASAGCSSPDWDRSFRSEMARLFPDHPMTPIAMDHPIFHTVYDVTSLQGLHTQPRPLEGISIGGRIGVLYSVDGLNDTAHTQGCCCCGGNEITNCEQINVNILAYSLLY